MNSITPQNASYRELAETLNAERTAQLAYAKYFLVADASKADIIPLLRLFHTNACRTLEYEIRSMGLPLPDYVEDAGPFREDPRHPIFDIDEQLVWDYLTASEAKLEQRWLKLAEINSNLVAVSKTRSQELSLLLACFRKASGEELESETQFVEDSQKIASFA